MQPAARVAAAADILDRMIAGEAIEKCLTTWGRKNRYAGSKDRAAIRDYVFQAWRCARSYAALGGAAEAPTGRALMIGVLRAQGLAPETLFTGVGHAPEPLSEEEAAAGAPPVGDAATNDMPDWLWPLLEASLGEAAAAEAQMLRARAPVFLRVNSRKATLEQAIKALAEDNITAEVSDLAKSAVLVTEGERKVALSGAFADGLVELQDAASQAVVDALPLAETSRVLDYCAGGGGKSLAIAASCEATVFAHDIAPERMKDIPERAERAGCKISVLEPEALVDQTFDLVFCDAPCSGSGAWRRAPDGKWRLTPESLIELTETQLAVLSQASQHVGEGGALSYATCSLLACENGEVVDAFVKANPEWQSVSQRSWRLMDGADGFFLAILRRV